MNRLSPKRRLLYAAFLLFPFASLTAQVPIVPPADELNKPFGESDEEAFASPRKFFIRKHGSITSGATYPRKELPPTWKRSRRPAFLEYNCSTDSSAAFGPARNRRSPASVRCGTMPSGIPQRSASGWDCALRCKDVPAGRWRAARGSNRNRRCAIWHGAGRTPRPGPAT